MKGWKHKSIKPKNSEIEYIYDVEIEVETPDGRGRMAIIRNCNYDLKKDEFKEYGTDLTLNRKWFINRYKLNNT